MGDGVTDSGEFDGSVEDYAIRFSRLKVNQAGGHASPHKPCMLLALIDLAEGGDLVENEIRYEPALLERYHQYFDAVRSATDHPNSYFPFFHLRSESFWHLVPREDREPVLQAMTTTQRHRDITENIAYARVDEDLHRLLQQPQARSRLRDVLISRWFAARADGVRAVIGEREAENDVERTLRGGGDVVAASPAVRDSAFRRVVLEVYDYRCAASGQRLVIPGVAVLMDAAHLIPFATSGNDAPTNGMALTPTYHRALDRHLIAPGPDFKWHVSPLLDSRIQDYEPLLRLEGQDVLFHGQPRHRPSREGLEWRVEHLRVEE